MEDEAPAHLRERERVKNKPWAALGINRAAYYRYLENGEPPRETNVSATMLRPLPRVALSSSWCRPLAPSKRGRRAGGAHHHRSTGGQRQQRSPRRGQTLSGEDR